MDSDTDDDDEEELELLKEKVKITQARVKARRVERERGKGDKGAEGQSSISGRSKELAALTQAVQGLTSVLSHDFKIIGRPVEVLYNEAEVERSGDASSSGVEGKTKGWCRGVITRMTVEFEDGEFEVEGDQPYRLC